jgi:bacillithiol system protein YtxJ
VANLKELTTIEEWKKLVEASREKPLFVFKHSTTCPVSANAWQEYQSYLKDNPNPKMTFTSVKVIESRQVSNQIAEDLDIRHQSPQVILIKNKKGIWNTSHWNINKGKITEVLNDWFS